MWRTIMPLKHEAVAMALSRQNLPTIDRTRFASAAGVSMGAYVVADAEDGDPDVILIGTGSEVSLCITAWEQLVSEGIKARVVSMPCWQLFARQTPEYRDLVLPPSIKARVSVEQASTFGWERWVGDEGAMIGMTTFGASAPLEDVQKEFGFTTEFVVSAAKEQISRNG